MKICIDIGNGQYDYIKVRWGDSPSHLATEFAAKHGLTEKLQDLLK